jgi:hypothetical protein
LTGEVERAAAGIQDKATVPERAVEVGKPEGSITRTRARNCDAEVGYEWVEGLRRCAGIIYVCQIQRNRSRRAGCVSKRSARPCQVENCVSFALTRCHQQESGAYQRSYQGSSHEFSYEF